MENFISKVKKTVESVKTTPKSIQKKIIERTSLGLNRSMPQPNPLDNTIEDVRNYYVQEQSTNKEGKEDTKNKSLDIAA